MYSERCLHGNFDCTRCGFPMHEETTPDCALHIHETALEDAAFKIACDLGARRMVPGGEALDAVTRIIKQTLKHQLHLQRTWSEEDESVSTRQLWSRPV